MSAAQGRRSSDRDGREAARSLTGRQRRSRHAPGVLASAATGIVGFIEKHAAATSTASSAMPHLCPTWPAAPTLKLRAQRLSVELFEEAARQTKHGNFGLWFGNQFQPRDLGMWGYAAVSAPTLGSALENLVGLFRYHQESSAMHLVLGSDGLMRLEYQITRRPSSSAGRMRSCRSACS